MQEVCPASSHLGGDDTLLRVEVGTGLVDQVDVRWLTQAHGDGHALELTPWEEG